MTFGTTLVINNKHHTRIAAWRILLLVKIHWLYESLPSVVGLCVQSTDHTEDRIRRRKYLWDVLKIFHFLELTACRVTPAIISRDKRKVRRQTETSCEMWLSRNFSTNLSSVQKTVCLVWRKRWKTDGSLLEFPTRQNCCSLFYSVRNCFGGPI